ncbi:pyridoxal-phosphate dependent enzyme [Labrys neptuniae]|uniref:pyridoxal-phosphate dependent enzyme n=1 Tax=Labrys neptuniae TaxID=376174 RepID=UPI002890DF36|nr:pyridoxal-phosphate dependent enzyme [Labrys neptuniae]MDT3382498.1 pyridoxal-phosphate dependent enzyme [Labrys neptuniae]
MPDIYSSILETIGNTPVIRLARLEPKGIELYAKLEAFNPLGSVKDRLALGVIEAAERDGRLQPGQTVIEATSGNTGIGLAMVCARKGYPLVIVMAESFSVERRKLMRFLGAQVVLTPASEKGTGMVEKARELAAAHGWFWTRQFENEANADVHSDTTAREILRDFGGSGPDYFVTGAGTGGTLKGVARVLRAESPNTRIIVAEPENAPMLASGIDQQYKSDATPAASHPLFRPHPMQGWNPDFIPKLTADAVDSNLIDGIQPVGGSQALRLARELARQEGIFCGVTGGATLAAALEVAKTARPGSRILFMVPDTGERYLSTPLFETIEQEMDAAERKISNSTPLCRFGVPAAQPAAVSAAAIDTAPDHAHSFVDQAIKDPGQPVVMFALEWCEFCWAVRRFLKDMGVPFRSVDLDSVAMQAGGLGGDIRKVLRPMTGAATIPQIFIGGIHVGGSVDLLQLHDAGKLVSLLAKAGVTPAGDITLTARSYLPKWLAARPAA